MPPFPAILLAAATAVSISAASFTSSAQALPVAPVVASQDKAIVDVRARDDHWRGNHRRHYYRPYHRSYFPGVFFGVPAPYAYYRPYRPFYPYCYHAWNGRLICR